MIRRPPRSTPLYSSAASDVYKRQTLSPIHKTAINEIRKDAGLALRFPKFTGKIRVEKIVEDASTDEEVMSLYKGQNKAAHDKNLM